MKKLFIHILFLTTLCALLANCKYEPWHDPGSCGDATTIEEMKLWVYFKTGTYWIYEEETSGEKDTVTVIDSFDGTSGGGFAAFSATMHSTKDNYNYIYWFNESYSSHCANEWGYCRMIFCDKSRPGDFVGEGSVFVFPLYSDNYRGVGYGGGDGGLTKVV